MVPGTSNVVLLLAVWKTACFRVSSGVQHSAIPFPVWTSGHPVEASEEREAKREESLAKLSAYGVQVECNYFRKDTRVVM